MTTYTSREFLPVRRRLAEWIDEVGLSYATCVSFPDGFRYDSRAGGWWARVEGYRTDADGRPLPVLRERVATERVDVVVEKLPPACSWPWLWSDFPDAAS